MRNDFQPSLFGDDPQAHVNRAVDNSKWEVKKFSADGFFFDKARTALEREYMPLVEVTDKFSRQSVSYQMSKKDAVSRWLKYKEGFSCDLVETLLEEMEIKAGATVIDPFAGSGTTPFVCKMKGFDSVSIDIMPMSALAIHAKCDVFDYSLDELARFIDFVRSLNRPQSYTANIPEIKITQSAYPERTSRDLSFFKDEILSSRFSQGAKNLGLLALVNSLERLSWTSKDGQYLRWDVKSQKIIDANKARAKKNLPPLKIKLDKKDLPAAKDALIEELEKTVSDIALIQSSGKREDSRNEHFQESALKRLALLDSGSIDCVITSPPYCNRYDYTRIYALELVFLGETEARINSLRQELLSCTVESKSKRQQLKEYYNQIGRLPDYEKIISIIESATALTELLSALEARAKNGDMNNKGVLKMVKGYFDELSFVFFELYRICKKGAQVAIVNDNVRYAGEVATVDFICSKLAERCGFTVKKIFTLKQQKGNSSQQMKKFGRVPLRKSITIWQK